MKWFYLFLLIIPCCFLPSCMSFPVPYPGILVPADTTTLYRSSCLRFNGKLYVLGGYYEKKVPTIYNACSPGLFCNEPGMEYDTINVLNKSVFEITDPQEAFIIENNLNKNMHSSLTINPGSWKSIGTVRSSAAIRDSQYYLEFRGNIYAVGGTGYDVEKEKPIQYADVWMSSDMTNWKQIAGKVPWSMEKNCRRNHQLTVADNAMYLAGGIGMALDGEKKQVDYNDVWKSDDGKNWHKEDGTFPYPAENQVLQLNGVLFHIEEQSRLYVSTDGKNWQRRIDTSNMLGIMDQKLAMIVSGDLYFSDDGWEWRHSKTGKLISFTPRVLDKKVDGDDVVILGSKLGSFYEDYDYTRYSGFNLQEFKNALWLIGRSAERLYKSNDGVNWNKVMIQGNRFPPRSGAATGAYNGYIWVMGGAWQNSVALGDIWKSRDGVDWELVTNNVPWGTSRSGSMFVAKGRLYLVKRGVQWDKKMGVVAHPQEIWSTTDGTTWRQESDKSSSIIVQTCNMENFDRVVETRDALYFLDDQFHQRFLRNNSNDTVQATFLLNNFRPPNSTEVRIKGNRPVFLSIKRGGPFETSSNLIQWEYCSLKTKTDQEGRGIGTNLLLSGDSGIRYKLVMFKNRLFAVGVDFNNESVFSAEMRLDAQNNSIWNLTAGHVSDPDHKNHIAPPVTSENRRITGSNSVNHTLSAVKKVQDDKIDPDTIRFKVVEHLSWDAYHGPEKGFLHGHKDNKPIAGMSFKIKLPNGSVVEKTTDKSGVIEIKGLSLDSSCDISYEEDDSGYPHAMFYESNQPILPHKVNLTGKKLIWKKSGLIPGRVHLFSY